MKTILIVDDEADLVKIVSEALEAEGYKTITAHSGYEGIQKTSQNPDLIILDIMMPDISGYNVCYSIRDKTDVPILFLSARDDESDIIKGLGIGADDYITKPFGLKELTSRVAAHLRRESRHSDEEKTISFGDIKIDFAACAVYKDGENVNLTKREYEIIELLVLNAGQVFSKAQIYDRVWGYEGSGDDATVAEHVKRIRNKIGGEHLETVWGIGYKWER